MKNKLILFLFSLLAVGQLSAAGIGTSTRAEVAACLNRIVAREVTGATVKISGVKASKSKVRIYTTTAFSYYPFRPANAQAIRDSIRAILPREYRKAAIEVYSDGREMGNLIPMFYRNESAQSKMTGFVNPAERPLVSRVSSLNQPQKGLSGRHIALWQSHGRYFDQARNRWKWQRSRLWQTCEDLYTQSYVVPYLVPMLERAGACVMLPRERDVQKIEVLADNDAAGQYRETGTWSSSAGGFAHLKEVYHTGENPFRHGSTRQTRSSSAGATASAEWIAEIPEAGEYAVYVSYAASSSNVDDADYTVHHRGGESRFAVNQTMGGGTWIYLGKFAFQAGKQSVVTLSNHSRHSDRIVSADAVKIGGGFGNIARSVSAELRTSAQNTIYDDETSGYPRFCEGSRYWLQWAGFDESVYTPKGNLDDYKDDYMSRAHWVNALMGGSTRLPDSVGLHIPIEMALAFHSDAGVRDGDEIVGTLGIYCTKDNNGKFIGGADRFRSRDLTDLVMTQVVGDIRQTYEPEWSRRGLWNRSYYEARVPSVPTMLLELLSHQNFADMRYGSDPRFKFTVSRAVYKGILRYITSQHQLPYVVQPLPVEAFRIGFEGETSVRLEWQAVNDPLEPTAVPTAYIVYTRIGDGGFDNGTLVKEPVYVTEQKPGEIYSYRITAINDGGESFPSETLAACQQSEERGRLLIINGFDRIAAPMSIRCDSLAGFMTGADSGVADRQDISYIGAQRIFDLTQARCEDDSRALGACLNDYETDVIGGNTFDYPMRHGKSAAKAGYSFCSSSLRAIEQGTIDFSECPITDLILGKQRSTTIGRDTTGIAFKAFSPALQQVLSRYKQAGGALFVSGCYVASDLKTEADQQFGREILRIVGAGSEPTERARLRVVAAHKDFSRIEYLYNHDFSASNYPIDSTDGLQPAGEDAFVVLRAVDGNRPAGIASPKTFVMSVPFEAINRESQRDRLMKNILNYLSNKDQTTY